MDLLKQITIDPSVRFGKPCVRGPRLTAGDVPGTLAAGSTEAELMEDFPQLTHEDMLAGLGLAFAAEPSRALSKDQPVKRPQRADACLDQQAETSRPDDIHRKHLPA